MLYQDMEMPETPFGAISAKFQIQLPVTVRILELFRMKKLLKLDIKRLFIIESDATIVAPLIFAYLLDLEEYLMKRVIVDYAKLTNEILNFSGKFLMVMMIQTSFVLEMQKTN
jgi:hypothetical protein